MPVKKNTLCSEVTEREIQRLCVSAGLLMDKSGPFVIGSLDIDFCSYLPCKHVSALSQFSHSFYLILTIFCCSSVQITTCQLEGNARAWFFFFSWLDAGKTRADLLLCRAKKTTETPQTRRREDTSHVSMIDL